MSSFRSPSWALIDWGGESPGMLGWLGGNRKELFVLNCPPPSPHILHHKPRGSSSFQYTGLPTAPTGADLGWGSLSQPCSGAQHILQPRSWSRGH